MKNKFLFCILNILLITNIIGCGSVTSTDTNVGEKEEIVSVQEDTSLNTEESPDDSTEESGKQVQYSPDETKTIAFHDKTFKKSDLSQETIEWLEWYNNLTEEEQLAISSIPSDLYELCGYPKAETIDATEPDFGFADLSKRQFIFTSGAGGWEETFTIEKDGYFTGKYHDSDMGSVGEGYPDGTVYGCTYSGYFTDLTKINDYTYTMKLSEITYKESGDTEEIKDNVRYIYTGSYCLGGNDTFTIYLPGAPLSELSEEVCRWLFVDQESESELSMIAIVDEVNEYGIYSQERPAPLEDAKMTFDTYKNSYDYYGEKLSEAMTTLEMVEYTGRMYEISDECLNYIWNLIRYNVDEDKYEEILAEQREWIDEKESRGEEVRQEYGEGSFAAVDYNDIMANVTMERCEELIAYLE